MSQVDMLFFFFKQKTAYEMRISDWSSDVCSSDLLPALEIDEAIFLLVAARNAARGRVALVVAAARLALAFGQRLDGPALPERRLIEIGRASCSERVCQYV